MISFKVNPFVSMSFASAPSTSARRAALLAWLDDEPPAALPFLPFSFGGYLRLLVPFSGPAAAANRPGQG